MTCDDITKEQLVAWLGSDATLDEALSVILDVANGHYPPHILFDDISIYSEGQ